MKLESLVEVAMPQALRGVCDDDRAALGCGIVAYGKAENKVSLGFGEGLNNKIRVIQGRTGYVMRSLSV